MRLRAHHAAPIVVMQKYPAPYETTAMNVRRQRGRGAPRLIVLDDDPTGTQSVADIPVITSLDRGQGPDFWHSGI